MNRFDVINAYLIGVVNDKTLKQIGDEIGMTVNALNHAIDYERKKGVSIPSMKELKALRNERLTEKIEATIGAEINTWVLKNLPGAANEAN